MTMMMRGVGASIWRVGKSQGVDDDDGNDDGNDDDDRTSLG